MDKVSNSIRKNKIQLFSEFDKTAKEKIAANISTRFEDAYLSPIVEDYVYATTRAVDFGDYYGKQNKKSSFEWAINKNADYFDYSELIEDNVPETNKPRYSSFNTAHMYMNHNSQHIENSIGLVFDSYPVMDDYEDQHVTVLFAIDKKREPRIARQLETYPTRVPVSMGCAIKYSVCTACGFEVRKADQLCDCLQYSRGQRRNGKKVAELLRGVNFYELSVVNTPACHTAFVIDAVSEIVPGRLLKVASTPEGQEIAYIMNNVYKMIKEARTSEEQHRLLNNFDKLIVKLENLQKQA